MEAVRGYLLVSMMVCLMMVMRKGLMDANLVKLMGSISMESEKGLKMLEYLMVRTRV